MPLSSRLGNAIRPTHTRIELLPISLAMIVGRIERPTYCRLLEQLLPIHEALEDQIAVGTHYGLYQPEMARAAAIRRDLQVLGGDPVPSSEPAALSLIGAIDEWAETAPVALLGTLYVFEGSRMGSLVLTPPLARALGVRMEPGHGLDYHLSGAHDTPHRFRQFKAGLDSAPLSLTEMAAVEYAAEATMNFLYFVYEAVAPAESELPAYA